MESHYTICNGAFEATLIKGKWEYTPTYKKQEKKVEKKGFKEKPQYAFVEMSEKEMTVRYRETLTKITIDIIKFLKTIT